MAIITISRGSYSRGKEVAEKLAQKLGYECVSRDIVLEACEEFNIPEVKLIRTLHDSPSVLERFKHGKERYMSYFRYALLKHVKNDNVVYHGLAGQYLLRHLPHVFKVRIISDMEDRVTEEMKRENITAEKALYILKKDDEERRKWGLYLYNTDTWDSRLYDMVLHINTLSVNDVVEVLYETAQKPVFTITEESKLKIDECVLVAKIHSMLVQYSPTIRVAVKNRKACISEIGNSLKTDGNLRLKIENLVKSVDGIDEVVIKEPLEVKKDYINPFYNI